MHGYKTFQYWTCQFLIIIFLSVQVCKLPADRGVMQITSLFRGSNFVLLERKILSLLSEIPICDMLRNCQCLGWGVRKMQTVLVYTTWKYNVADVNNFTVNKCTRRPHTSTKDQHHQRSKSGLYIPFNSHQTPLLSLMSVMIKKMSLKISCIQAEICVAIRI